MLGNVTEAEDVVQEKEKGGEPEVHLSVPGTRGEQFGRLATGQRDLVPTVVCHEYSNARSRAIQRVNSPEVPGTER